MKNFMFLCLIVPSLSFASQTTGKSIASIVEESHKNIERLAPKGTKRPKEVSFECKRSILEFCDIDLYLLVGDGAESPESETAFNCAFNALKICSLGDSMVPGSEQRLNKVALEVAEADKAKPANEQSKDL